MGFICRTSPEYASGWKCCGLVIFAISARPFLLEDLSICPVKIPLQEAIKHISKFAGRPDVLQISRLADEFLFQWWRFHTIPYKLGCNSDGSFQ
jgi:hypothetical protein